MIKKRRCKKFFAPVFSRTIHVGRTVPVLVGWQTAKSLSLASECGVAKDWFWWVNVNAVGQLLSRGVTPVRACRGERLATHPEVRGPSSSRAQRATPWRHADAPRSADPTNRRALRLTQTAQLGCALLSFVVGLGAPSAPPSVRVMSGTRPGRVPARF